jgi:hypothetical protein
MDSDNSESKQIDEAVKKDDEQKMNEEHAAQYFPVVHSILDIISEAKVPLHDASNPTDKKKAYEEVEPVALKCLDVIRASGINVETYTKDVEVHVKTVIQNVLFVITDKLNASATKLVESRFDGKLPSRDMSIGEISDLLDATK